MLIVVLTTHEHVDGLLIMFPAPDVMELKLCSRFCTSNTVPIPSWLILAVLFLLHLSQECWQMVVTFARGFDRFCIFGRINFLRFVCSLI